MRRLSLPSRKRSVRCSIRVEFLEDRQLLSTAVLPVNSANNQYSEPASLEIISGPSSTPPSATPSTINPLAGSPVSAPYSPAQIRHAYGVDQLSNLDGTGQTIAIVDAYADPSAASDLAAFDSYYKLPTANLSVVDAEPTEGTLVSNGDWDLETSLDIEWAHAIAPGAKILLVEAYSDADTDLFNAVTYAVNQGAKQVSMSWGGPEYSGETSLNSYFTPVDAPGVSFFASSGDTGGQVLYPAISPYVTSVGGTTISLDAQGNRVSESAWAGGGGGQSQYVTEPAYQTGFQSTGYRTTPDVSYDADPNSGFLVIDNGSYIQVGGTSAGSPQWAAIMSLANEGLSLAGKPSVGTGQLYGTNSVLYQLAGSTSYTNPNGDFLDITTGNNTHAAIVGYDEATGLGVPLANLLVPNLIGTTVPTVADPDFQATTLANATFQYDPTGFPWTFTGQSGVSTNGSAFTYDNPSAPVGNQVAILQEVGSFSQSLSNWSAGSYTISFDAAQRANFGNQSENFAVEIDGNVVGTFKPYSTSYAAYATAAFTVTAGTHTLSFVGLDTAGGDNTAFLDAVSVAVATTSTSATVADPDFQATTLANATFQYDPTGFPWTFTGQSGVSTNGSGFTYGNPSAPVGNQVAILQEVGSFSEPVANWSAGSYTISFDAAQRANFGNQSENFAVEIDGVVVGTFLPTSTSYQAYTTASFLVSAGTHTLSFVGLDTAGGDNTVFIDGVSIG